MNIAIVGYGEQGRSSFEYWNNQDNSVTICDQNTELALPEGAIGKLGLNYLEDLHEFDLIVRSPSVHPQTILDANPDHPEIAFNTTTNTNEFFNVCLAPIIGVTGTKGKGTTSSLIAKILEAKGKKVHLGGNIGTPPLDLLQNNIKSDDIVVLELANFQLIDLKRSPHIAVCLMITEEHLDWHGDFYEYIEAKEQMFKHQNSHDIAIYNAKNAFSEEIATKSPAQVKLPYDVPAEDEPLEYTDGAYVEGKHIKMQGKVVCDTTDVALKGRHNLQNVCAAIAATWELVGQDASLIKKVVKEFKGLPHRLEEVKTVDDITFYNDSFASNPGATIAAIEAISAPKVLIIGGFDRMIPLDNLTGILLEHIEGIRKILLIGESKDRVAKVFQKNGINNFEVSNADSMQVIVAQALSMAKKGDSIILTPGFPSFDMFKNFEDRGNQFKESVNIL